MSDDLLAFVRDAAELAFGGNVQAVRLDSVEVKDGDTRIAATVQMAPRFDDVNITVAIVPAEAKS